jgi:hypothetical protein
MPIWRLKWVLFVVLSYSLWGCSIFSTTEVEDASPTTEYVRVTAEPTSSALNSTPKPESVEDIIAKLALPTRTATAILTLPPTHTPLPTPKAGTPSATPTITPTPTPTLTPSPTRLPNENPLTGLIVATPDNLKKRPLHIRLGNDPKARPQVNLNLADIVYEEIVEWWITRLTAVYYTHYPAEVAPIRSARIINIQLTQQYQAALANSGASDAVRWLLQQAPLVNLDEYFNPEPYTYRPGESWQTRLAVDAQAAQQYLSQKRQQKTVKLRGFMFDENPPDGEAAMSVFIDYPSPSSKVLWRFNPQNNKYERYVNNELMLDKNSEVIAFDNIIIYFAEHYRTSIVEDSTGATSVGISMNGEGIAWIFRDGLLVKGRWRTDGTQTPEFIDATDKAIPLRPGQTWIQVVPEDYEIGVN